MTYLQLLLDSFRAISVLQAEMPHHNETLLAPVLDSPSGGVHRPTDVNRMGARRGALPKDAKYSHFDKIAKAAHDARR